MTALVLLITFQGSSELVDGLIDVSQKRGPSTRLGERQRSKLTPDFKGSPGARSVRFVPQRRFGVLSGAYNL